MKEHRRRVTIDIRDPVQRELYDQFTRARAAWGDQGQKLDLPIIQALQEQARIKEEVIRQQREMQRQERAAREERQRHLRGDDLRQRYREQDARNQLVPAPNAREFQSPDDFMRAMAIWREAVKLLDPGAQPQYPPGVYPVPHMDAVDFGQRRIAMRDAVNMERQRQNEQARQLYNAGVVERQQLVELGDAAMRDLFRAPAGPPTPEERALQQARDFADRVNLGRMAGPPHPGMARAHDFFYHPEEPKAIEEPAHLQEFDEV